MNIHEAAFKEEFPDMYNKLRENSDKYGIPLNITKRELEIRRNSGRVRYFKHDDIKEIRSSSTSFQTVRDLSNKHKVSTRTIRDIQRGKSYKHVI